MTTSTLTLADFIRARLDEDEAAALAATSGPWRHDPSKEWHTDSAMLERARANRLTFDGEEFVAAGPLGASTCVAATGPSNDARSMADAGHIARHDPARVLAEVAAKRAILEEATEADAIERTAADNAGWDGDKYDTAGSAILRHLAAVYSAHPDYDERWRP